MEPPIDAATAKYDLLAEVEFRSDLRRLYGALAISDRIRDLRTTAARLDAEIHIDPTRPNAAAVFIDKGRFVISLGPYDRLERARFAVAHEIAHIAIERGYLEFARSRMQTLAEQEQLCDFVAGLLLMPLDTFVPAVLKIARATFGNQLRSLRTLAAHYGVSLKSCLLQVGLLHCVRFSSYSHSSLPGRNHHSEVHSARWRSGHTLLRSLADCRRPNAGETIRLPCGELLHERGLHWSDPDAYLCLERGSERSRSEARVFLRPLQRSAPTC